MNKLNLIIKTLILFVFSIFSHAQKSTIKSKTYFPKDSIAYNNESDFEYNLNSNLFGKTTMIIESKTKNGNYHFVFKKKIIALERLINFNDYSTSEKYNYKTKKWEYSENSNVKKNSNEIATDTLYISQHNLYAFVYVEDHGGLLEKCKFQDFGNEVYWPEFDYANCMISDEDNDNIPEFYLSYMGESDGLDAKPYKQIIYSIKPEKNIFIKSKATAFYPFGNEDDTYNIVYDENWIKLKNEIKNKSNYLLQLHKKKYLNNNDNSN